MALPKPRLLTSKRNPLQLLLQNGNPILQTKAKPLKLKEVRVHRRLQRALFSVVSDQLRAATHGYAAATKVSKTRALW